MVRHKNGYGFWEELDRLPVPGCSCNKCIRAADRDAERETRRSQRQSRGGTTNDTAFRTRERQDGSGKTDILFNSPGDGSRHGHVVERTDSEGNKSYPYARDVEGNVYADDSDDD